MYGKNFDPLLLHNLHLYWICMYIECSDYVIISKYVTGALLQNMFR